MQTVAEGQQFGPITDKLVRDLLNAGIRLSSQIHDNPDQLGARLQAYTVEITTALALAVGKIETAALGTQPQAAPRRRPKRTAAGHLSLIKGDALD